MNDIINKNPSFFTTERKTIIEKLNLEMERHKLSYPHDVLASVTRRMEDCLVKLFLFFGKMEIHNEKSLMK